MWQQPLVALSPAWRFIVRGLFVLLLGVVTVASIGIVSLLQHIQFAVTTVTEPPIPPFPLGVDPVAERIIERPDIETFREETVATQPQRRTPSGIIDRLAGVLAQSAWLQQLALSSSRMLVIYPGERQEEIARNFAAILRWDETEREHFIATVLAANPDLPEGSFLPGKYVVPREADPELVAQVLIDNFNREIRQRYPDNIDAVVPFTDALVIASLLEREAFDFTDMREISGVIWNRLFQDMPLQLDATLQYARATGAGAVWWPIPRSQDKWIDSPFNTYQNEGLPPHPIANPSPEAVLAALNPIATDCIFYIHAPSGAFYCAASYEEHRANINRYLR
jgi:cell division protein YceG involved in septum cleavage